MSEIRQTFLETSRIGRDLLAVDAVRERWDEPSALDHWSVSGLGGHLARATTVVIDYLDRPEPEVSATGDAVAYYDDALATDDLESELHKGIRSRGDEMAAGGHSALVSRWDEALGRLNDRLGDEPPTRRVEVFKGFVLHLDDYLVTRILEMVVHIDDLAVSVGVPTPELPQRATELTIRTLVDFARHRHGDLSVTRALARRERDTNQALRVL